MQEKKVSEGWARKFSRRGVQASRQNHYGWKFFSPPFFGKGHGNDFAQNAFLVF